MFMNSRYKEIVNQIQQLERTAATLSADEARVALEEIRAKVQAFGLNPRDIFCRHAKVPSR